MIAITTLLLIGIVAVLLYISYEYSFKKPENCPPGPPRLPLVGSYLFLLIVSGKWLHKGALWLSKFYKSDVISLYIGDYMTYVAHSQETIKEILYNGAYDGRPDAFIVRMRHPHQKIKGILSVQGSEWKEQRWFFLRHLRDFGFGRRFEELELIINEEIKDLIDLIKNGPEFQHEKEIVQNGKVLCPYILVPFAANCIFHVMFGERLPRSEQMSLVELGKYGMMFHRNSDAYGKLLNIIPWIRFFFPKTSGYEVLMKANTYLYDFFEKIVKKNMDTCIEGCERNFLDLYLNEMKKEELKENHETTFLHDQLVLGLLDFGLSALTTISSQLSLIFQWLLLTPDVLKKVQAEIDEHVGSGRLPCLDDRKNLHYTEATIREGLRMETLIPSSILHVALEDTKYFGYDVKKGTIMVPSLYGLHMDERIWKDPENFRPERFLDSSGKLSLKLDFSLPFGAGKRLCAGETFARNVLFLLFASLCQNFNIILSPGENPPDLQKNLNGLLISPPDYWLTMEPR